MGLPFCDKRYSIFCFSEIFRIRMFHVTTDSVVPLNSFFFFLLSISYNKLCWNKALKYIQQSINIKFRKQGKVAIWLMKRIVGSICTKESWNP